MNDLLPLRARRQFTASGHWLASTGKERRQAKGTGGPGGRSLDLCGWLAGWLGNIISVYLALK